MNRHQKMVEAMMEVFEQTCPDGPELQGYPFLLRAKLIHEEAKEFMLCAGVEYDPGLDDYEYNCNNVDWVGMIDAMCDILVVTYGAASAMGIDLEPYFAEVHRTNMAKAPDGKVIRRESDGKVLKPEGWEPPRISEMLVEDFGNHDKM